MTAADLDGAKSIADATLENLRNYNSLNGQWTGDVWDNALITFGQDGTFSFENTDGSLVNDGEVWANLAQYDSPKFALKRH